MGQVALRQVGPGIEPVSPVLAGGFFTTEPPGKSFEIYPVSDVAFFFFFLMKELESN